MGNRLVLLKHVIVLDNVKAIHHIECNITCSLVACNVCVIVHLFISSLFNSVAYMRMCV